MPVLRTPISRGALLAVIALGAFELAPLLSASSAPRTEMRDGACSIVRAADAVELHSPFFVFRLSAERGLLAESWLNRLTGRKIALGRGSEVEFDIGLPDQALRTPALRVLKTPASGATSEAVFELASDEPKATVTVRYRWNASEPVLRKFVTITNTGQADWNRLLNVRLGVYQTDVLAGDADPDFPVYVTERHNSTKLALHEDPAGRVRGFPAYLGREFFLSLAHPAGWSTREASGVSLRQYPGRKLAPSHTFECMEVVYGVGARDQARAAFRAHLATRMRRVLRGHNKPYAIFEPFGGWPESARTPGRLFWEDEKVVMDLLQKVGEGQRDSGSHFDMFSIDFWHDSRGALEHPDAERFPNGFGPILQALQRLDTAPGLWVDSGGIPDWTIGNNPAIQPAITLQDGRRTICFATDPVKRLYTEGFLYHIRHNGVKLLKFDNFGPNTLEPVCDNPKHEHLPGVYSTEAIVNGAIEFYRALQEEDVFIMLYWCYRSPWWLLYGDTLFDAGTRIEAASFTAFPAPYARDSTTRRLDQARWLVKDMPPLGWDTLGVWLSDWAWNSRVGKARWQSGVAMDICRGHLLAQVWSDPGWLSPPERRQMADFIGLLKGGAGRFRNCRFIYGNPWQDEPYGYACSDGQRAFVAINNGVWSDNVFGLELNSAWGLPEGRKWDLYRWFPEPARLHSAERRPFRRQASVSLRPFEIVLLEVTPAGQPPTLQRALPDRPIRRAFTEPSRAVELAVSEVARAPGQPQSREFVLRGEAPASARGGLITISAGLSDGSQSYWIREPRRNFFIQGKLAGRETSPAPVLVEGYPAPWQAWRVPVAPSVGPQPLEFSVTTPLPSQVRLLFKAHFIPGDTYGTLE